MLLGSLRACVPSAGDAGGQSSEQTPLRLLFVLLSHKQSIFAAIVSCSPRSLSRNCPGPRMSLTASSNVKLLHMWCQHRNHRFSLLEGKFWFEEVWCKTAGIKTPGSFLSINFYLQGTKSHPPAVSKSFLPQSKEKPKHVPTEQWEETSIRAARWSAAIRFDWFGVKRTKRGRVAVRPVGPV